MPNPITMSWLRWIRRGVIAVGATVVSIVAIVGVIFLLPAGKAFIAREIVSMINSGAGQKVSVGHAGGEWPSHIVLDGIALADRSGPWLDIDHLDLRIHPLALLSGRVDVQSLRLNHVRMLRAPINPPSNKKPKPLDSGPIIAILNRIAVAQLGVDSLTLAPSVVGEPVDVAINGTLGSENDAPVLHLRIDRHDAPGQAELAVSARDDTLTADVRMAILGIAATAKLQATIPRGALKGTIELACGDPRPCIDTPGARIFTVSGSLSASGSLAQPTLSGTLNAHDISAGTRRMGSIDGQITASLGADQSLTLSAEGTATGIKTAAPEVAAVIADDARWSLTAARHGTDIAVTAANLRSGDMELAFNGTIAGETVKSGAITANIGAPGRLAGWKADTSTLHAVVTLVTPLRQSLGQAHLHAELENLPADIANYAGHHATLDADVIADAQDIRIGNATLKSDRMVLQGQSLWSTDGGAIVHQSTMATLTVTDPSLLPQPAAAHLTFTGALEQVHSQALATIPQLALGRASAQNLTLEIDGRRNGAALDAAIKGSGSYQGKPLSLAATVTKPSGPWVTIDGLHLAWAAATVDGAIRYDLDRSIALGTTTAKALDLAAVGAALNLDLTGSADATVTLSANGHQRAVLVGTGKSLRFGTAQAASVSANVTAVFARGGPELHGHVQFQKGWILNRPLTSATITASGTLSRLSVTLNAVGPTQQPLAVAMGAELEFGPTKTISLSRFVGETQGVQARLEAPARLQFSSQQLTLTPLHMTVAGGDLTAEARWMRKDDAVEAKVSLTRLPVNALARQAILSIPSHTTLGLDVAVSGTARNPRIDGKAALDFDVGNHRRGEALLTLVAANGTADLGGTVTGLSPQPAELMAHVPFRADLDARRISMDKTAALSGSLRWDAPIAAVRRLLPFDDHVVTGQAQLDIAVAGSLGDPQIKGHAALKNGSYENVVQSINLHHLDLSLDAQNSSEATFTLAATDAKTGTMNGQGLIWRETSGRWMADISIVLKDLAVLNRDDVTAALSGPVSYNGPLFGGTIRGQLELLHATLHLDRAYVPAVPLLRSKEETRAELHGQPRTTSAGIAMAVDVKINDPMRVQANGLDSWWRGKLDLAGRTGHPEVSGTVTVDRGTFSFIGQTFTLQSGTLTFTGGGDIDPILNITATATATTVNATATITGLATQPSIALSSTQGLPQDEVLSRLMFQKSATQLGPLQSVQLASAAAELSGLSHGGINGFLQRNLGLTTVGLGGASGSAFVAGEQIGKRLYVELQAGLEGTGQQVEVQYRAFKNFVIKSTDNTQTGPDIGLQWQHNY